MIEIKIREKYKKKILCFELIHWSPLASGTTNIFQIMFDI